METTTERQWWEEQGYLAGRPVEAGLWLVVMPMIYTFRVALCTPGWDGAIQHFYCYTDLDVAMKCFDTWDGGYANPVEGWTKSHPRP